MTARKHGVELPDMRSETGFVAAKFWTEVALRDRDKEFEALTNFAPALLYTMAGTHASVEFGSRMEMLQPYMRELRASLLGIQRTSMYRKYRLDEQMNELKSQKQEFDQLDWIASDDFSLEKWLTQGA